MVKLSQTEGWGFTYYKASVLSPAMIVTQARSEALPYPFIGRTSRIAASGQETGEQRCKMPLQDSWKLTAD